MLALAYANAFLSPEEVELFETTQQVDEEIYESFHTN
jgi:hypothetical protein